VIIVFIHQNFPAQYRLIVRHFADSPENTVYFITQPNDNRMRGVIQLIYRRDTGRREGCHPYTHDIDDAIRTGTAVADVCRMLRDQGVKPDIIVGHNGWGETLYVKDVFPDVPVLAYFEFFYHATGVDVGFDPEYASIFLNDPSRLRAKNAVNIMGFAAADWGHTATRWQRSLYPASMRRRITAIHEGVDTDVARPDTKAWIRLAREGLRLTAKDEVITYISRSLEPYRGFHSFMRALPEIQRRRPRVHAVVLGNDGVSYGPPAAPGTNFREIMLREVGDRLDHGRVHFLGQLPYANYINVLQVSSVHFYLTYPFVLSWSFLEALACGCAVIGSSTPPVREVMEDRVNGLLVDFFSTEEIADRVDEILDHPDRMREMRRAARNTAVRDFDFKRRQLPHWKQLFRQLIDGETPSVVMMGQTPAGPRPGPRRSTEARI
jgi:glycosyltransferase involved in cell wall biosynthesis